MKVKIAVPVAAVLLLMLCGCAKNDTELPSYDPANEVSAQISEASTLPSDEITLIEPADPTQGAVQTEALQIVQGWFREYATQWKEAETGLQFYGETAKSSNGAEITILLYCGEYYMTELRLDTVDPEEIYTVAVPLIKAYLGRDLSDGELDTFQEAVAEVMYHPEEGVYVNDFDNAAPFYLYTDKQSFYINCY